MENRNVNLAVAAIAVIVALVLIVSYRARAFHYCIAFQERDPRVLSADEPCSPDEQQLDWKILGVAPRLKLIGATIVKALGELRT